MDYLERCGLFSDFQYGSRSSRSTAGLLTVISERIGTGFNKCRATEAIAFGIYKTFDRVWYCRLLMNFRFRCMLLFCPFSVIESFEWFWLGSLCKNNQLLLAFLKAPFLVKYLPYHTLMFFFMMLLVILLSMLMILPSTLSMIRHIVHGNNYN